MVKPTISSIVGWLLLFFALSYDHLLLSDAGVEKHLADFGVDAESASHTQINQLSGGMKVELFVSKP